MLSNPQQAYVRPYANELANRIAEPRRFMQALAGARQVGKSTLAMQVADRLDMPCLYASADEPALRGTPWIEQQWESARTLAGESGGAGALLILDEVQKVTGWSETVKRLWDEDTRAGRPLKAMVLGSAPLLIQRGLGESLAGRFELLQLPHWSYPEMRDAFGWTVEQYIFYGAYPGAASLVNDHARWASYIRDALIEPTLSRDVLLLSRVDKPALLRRLLELGCAYSGQILSYTKILGQLQDAGNTTTLAHYLELLRGIGMVTGLQKYSGGEARRRASSPKLQALNTALMTALSGLAPDEARADGGFRGRLVESAIGAHLANAAAIERFRLYYWRERNREVDFVVMDGRRLVGIEVKSGGVRETPAGMGAFSKAFPSARALLVGGDGIPVEDFLAMPVRNWLNA